MVINEGQLLQFTISGTDPDGDSVTYSALNLPAGASFDASTQIFTWTPTYTQSGTYDNGFLFEVIGVSETIGGTTGLNTPDLNDNTWYKRLC